MASTYLSKTFASSGNRQRQTISVWVKRNGLASGQNIFSVYYNSSIWGNFYFNSSDQLKYYNNGGAYDLTTNRRFRDTNAWYHIVIQLNTTEATASDRIKMYVNGVQETSFASTTYPTLNAEVTFGDNYSHYIGTYNAGTDNFDGSMSHFHFITNTAYDATAFGQFDANGVWTIKTDVSVTYGTNGFFILKDGNSVTDQSGNGNNFTVAGGTLTNTEDNPSNVFATFNALMHFRQPTPLLYGNTGIENGDARWENGYGTIATPTTGKFYAEFKYPVFGSPGYGHAGIIAVDDIATQASGYLNFGDTSNSWSLSVGDGSVYNSGSSIGTYSSISANGIIGLAIDCTNSKLYYSVNGTWQNSANPSTGTGGISITANKEYFVGSKVYNAYVHANYGNGYFGTTAVASAGTNASGNGIFEYDVPTGYTALSTKGLNL